MSELFHIALFVGSLCGIYVAKIVLRVRRNRDGLSLLDWRISEFEFYMLSVRLCENGNETFGLSVESRDLARVAFLFQCCRVGFCLCLTGI